jgi:hypothetical protein
VRGSDPLGRAIRLAATVGAFNPADVVRRVAEPDARRSLAAQLAPLCTEVSTADAVLWNLGSDARRQTLKDMQSAGELDTPKLKALFAQIEPQPRDFFGRYLRDALAGKPGPIVEVPDDWDALYSAYEFVGRSAVGTAPDQARESAQTVESEAQRATVSEQLLTTIGPLFVNRTAEVAELRRFALAGRIESKRFKAKTPPVPRRVPMLFVNGVGGSGKSALLAKVIHELRQSSSGVAAIIVLDFDRPTLADVNPVELTLDFIRQIGLSQPQLGRALNDMRRTALSQFTDLELTSGNPLQNYSYASRALYSLNARLREVLTGLETRPFLVILDTFEEVITLGADFVEVIYRWLDDIRRSVGLTQMRAIVSGRAMPTDLDLTPNASGRSALYANVIGDIALADLPPADAQSFLKQSGIATTLARELNILFGGNPLVLRMLRDYAKQKGAEAVAALIADDDGRKQYRAEMAQRILYSRILERIRNDEPVRALASPGLVVRVVTPGVIAHVLAEPCGLGRINRAEAGRLFDRLARYYWLVIPAGERAVAHRRDVRTLMLPLVREPKRGEDAQALATRIATIQENAYRYFAEIADPDLTPEVRYVEAVYHLMFVDPRRALGDPDPRLQAALRTLVGDLADFPALTRALIKRRLKRSLSPEERRALSSDEQREYAREQQARVAKVTGRATPSSAPDEDARVSGVGSESRGVRMAPDEMRDDAAAARLGEVQSVPAVRARTPPATDTEIAAAFAEAQFADVAAVCHDVLQRFADGLMSGRSRSYTLDKNLDDDVTWLTALSTLESAKESGDKNRGAMRKGIARSLIEQLDVRWKRFASIRLADKSNLTVAHYLAAIAMLVGEDQGIEVDLSTLARLVDKTSRTQPLAFTIASDTSLRIFQMLVALRRYNEFALTPKGVVASCTQYLTPLLDPRAIDKSGRALPAAQEAWRSRPPTERALQDALERIRAFDRRPSSHDLDLIERKLVGTRFDLYQWEPPSKSWGGPKYKHRREEFRRSWALLRGTCPELKPPLLTGLRELFNDRKAGAALLTRLTSASPAWPADLGPEALSPDRQVRLPPGVPRDETVGDTFLATMCHYAGRFGALQLLHQGARAGSVMARVGALRTAYDQVLESVTRSRS